MNLGILGCGYVGLTTGICLASLGHQIRIFDIDKRKISSINQKKLPFFENGLQELLEKVIQEKKLETVSSIKELIEKSDGCFVCVGTPSLQDNSIDLSQIVEGVKEIANSMKINEKEDYIIIIRSTIIPLTTKKKILPTLDKIFPSKKFGLAIVPEFLREGQALSDFMNPGKIVIGYNDQRSKEFVEKIFECFKAKATIISTNPETAEMIKYANNSFFSTLISFSNEIANISEKIKNVDAFKVMTALVADKRITVKKDDQKIIPDLVSYLIPGCGFGGSCFPKDLNAMVNFASSLGSNTPLLDAVLSINDERPQKIISLAKKLLEKLEKKKIAILGLSFKPETDDIRSSPAIEIIEKLILAGVEVKAYDPKISEVGLNDKRLSGIKLCKNINECLEGTELAILLTKWKEFEEINEEILEKNMTRPLIIDGRGFLDSSKFKNGNYYKIGFTE